MNHVIITGGSKGLGKALVETFTESGWRVTELSRSGSGKHHITADLSHTQHAVNIADEVFSSLSIGNKDKVLLINNAGVLMPINKVAAIPFQAMLDNLSVNLVTALAIIQSYITHFRNLDISKTLVNITSGAARKGYPGWSLYCTGKAGCENFINSIAAEEEYEPYPFKAINFNPSVMDTDMQAHIRSADPDHFPLKQRFVDFKNTGNLLSPKDVAQKLFELVSEPKALTQPYYSVLELL